MIFGTDNLDSCEFWNPYIRRLKRY